MTVQVTDPTPHDTDKYLIHYQRINHSDRNTEEQSKPVMKKEGDRSVAVLSVSGLHPYTRYRLEVASHFKDNDIGPYSVPRMFVTEEAGRLFLLNVFTTLLVKQH